MNHCGCNQINWYKMIGGVLICLILVAIVFGLIVCHQNLQEHSILTAVAENGDNLQLGTTTIKFSKNEIVEGTGITHPEGSDEIIINQTGIYQISYLLNGEDQTTESFNVNAILLVNQQALESTFQEGPVIRDIVNNRMPLTSTVILKLNAGDILKLQGVSIEDITYSRARIDIEQIKIL